jgi:hypothetical protein
MQPQGGVNVGGNQGVAPLQGLVPGNNNPRQRAGGIAQNNAPLPHWLDPAFVYAPPQGAGPYQPLMGYHVFKGTRHHASEGWKFHISAHPYNAEDLANTVLPILTQMNVWHKYLELNKLPTRQGVEVGKFIAVYPISCADAHAIAAALAAALHNRTGPAIASELVFGASTVLFARYGSFKDEWVLGPPNTNTKSLDPARGVRPYHQGQIRPSWVPDLTNDQNANAFPAYNRDQVFGRHGRGGTHSNESQATWVN